MDRDGSIPLVMPSGAANLLDAVAVRRHELPDRAQLGHIGKRVVHEPLLVLVNIPVECVHAGHAKLYHGGFYCHWENEPFLDLQGKTG
jgi:hypothetical protein